MYVYGGRVFARNNIRDMIIITESFAIAMNTTTKIELKSVNFHGRENIKIIIEYPAFHCNYYKVENQSRAASHEEGSLTRIPYPLHIYY